MVGEFPLLWFLSPDGAMKGSRMDSLLMIWINTLFLIAAAIVQGVIVYAVVREARKISETLSRVERKSLATLERLSPQSHTPQV